MIGVPERQRSSKGSVQTRVINTVIVAGDKKRVVILVVWAVRDSGAMWENAQVHSGAPAAASEALQFRCHARRRGFPLRADCPSAASQQAYLRASMRRQQSRGFRSATLQLCSTVARQSARRGAASRVFVDEALSSWPSVHRTARHLGA